MSKPIDFYFDFSSPYGYIASRRIHDIAVRHGREVSWRPFLLGAVFKVTGARPLVDQPLVDVYTERDLPRTARLYNVPFRMPSRFPVAGVAAARCFYWLSSQDHAGARKLIDALYAAYFVDDRDISDPAVVADVAVSQGRDRAQVSAALQDPMVKDRLRRETEAAIGRGVFGSPFVFVDGEPFWGNDRLTEVERWLQSGAW